MRNLEVIEKDLATAREALLSVEGTPAEVYSRIVGYYRSVRNWNLGKREEYGERRLFRISDDVLADAASFPPVSKKTISVGTVFSGESGPVLNRHSESVGTSSPASQTLLLLFVRASCPSCSPAKDAAKQLGIPVHLLNADTEEGLAEARRRKVLSTPTAILLSPGGKELGRAINAETIGALLPAEAVAV